MTTPLRPGRPDEAAALSTLALRSKGWWGYDEAFLERLRPVLTIHPDMCADGHVVVAEEDGEPVGFYQLEFDRRGARLTELFVAPERIGTGLGRRLWTDAVAAATARGCALLRFESDPHAEGFYLHLGASRIGEIETTPGRVIPLMSVALR